MRSRLLSVLLAGSACAVPHNVLLTSGPADPSATVGVLVMAHGGTTAWNESVADMVAPLAASISTTVAYGMADPLTLQAALDRLRDAGVDRVAVVRMFLSGESFFDQTNYFLGLADTPPETFVLMGSSARDPAARAQLDHQLDVATHTDGLLASPVLKTILTARALALSSTPSQESVLIIAHGMGDNQENERVIHAMQAVADTLSAQGFAEVEVTTLREDWAAKRVIAEEGIRDFVTRETSAGRHVIVLPMRLSGFGPYAEVLADLTYVPGEGLVPHRAVADWIRSTAAEIACSAGWGPAIGACPAIGPESAAPIG